MYDDLSWHSCLRIEETWYKKGGLNCIFHQFCFNNSNNICYKYIFGQMKQAIIVSFLFFALAAMVTKFDTQLFVFIHFLKTSALRLLSLSRSRIQKPDQRGGYLYLQHLIYLLHLRLLFKAVILALISAVVMAQDPAQLPSVVVESSSKYLHISNKII